MRLGSLFCAFLPALTAFAAPHPHGEDQVDQRPLDPLVKDKVPIDPKLWPTLQRYGAFSTHSIQGPCQPPPFGARLVTYIDDSGKDALSHARGKQIKDNDIIPSDTQAGIYRTDTEIIISFPGTRGIIDTIRNIIFVPLPWDAKGIECRDCGVHAGFQDAWKHVQDRVIAAVDQELKTNPQLQVVVSGHSLGGAIGTLAYASLKSLGYPVTAYITASPRVGTKPTADFIEKISGSNDEAIGSFYRITAYNDLVPQLPPNPVFVHPRTEIWLSGPTDPEQNEGNTFRCFGQNAPDCNAGKLPHSYDTHSEYNGTDDDLICDENGNLVPW